MVWFLRHVVVFNGMMWFSAEIHQHVNYVATYVCSKHFRINTQKTTNMVSCVFMMKHLLHS